MLKDVRNTTINLQDLKSKSIPIIPSELQKFVLPDAEVTEINYPVDEYPEKIKSLNFDKTPEIGGVLMGIRGQYLIFEDGEVLNIRKFSGYFIEMQVLE